MTLTVAVAGIGVAGPGLANWSEAAAVLAGSRPYAEAPLTPGSPGLLPANERRRASASVRLALRVAEEACRGGPCTAAEAMAVFASATGDSEIAHQMLEALAEPAPALSPTRFHNSVHNAPAGYWSISTGSHQGSTSVAAGDGSFATGLMLAAAQVAGDGAPVLLVCYDLPFPAPLAETRPIHAPFAVALLLTPPGGAGRALRVGLRPTGESETALADPALEALRAGTPAARALPLLAALAGGGGARVSLPAAGAGRLTVELLDAG